MVWAIDMADCINKILYIRGFPNIGAYIRKYSREGKRLTLNEYMKALQNLGVSSHYEEKDQKRFFNYCSQNQAEVSLDTIESEIKKYGTKTIQKMKDELILELKDDIDTRFKSYKDLQILFDENGERGVMTKKLFRELWV